MTKRSWIAVLVCMNLALLASILFVTAGPPAAYAQAGAISNNYALVTGEISSDFDATYLIDVRAKRMYTFTLERGRGTLVYSGFRDLEQDFRFAEEDRR